MDVLPRLVNERTGRVHTSYNQSVAATGGTPQTLVEIAKDSAEQIIQPQMVGEGGALVYTVRTSINTADGKIVVQQPIDGGARRVLVDGGADGRVLSTGHLVWARDNTLYAQMLDLATLQPAGGPVPMVEGVMLPENYLADAIGATGKPLLRVSAQQLLDRCRHLVFEDRWGFFLDAPADVLQSRKQEVPFDETARQRSAYRELAAQLPQGRIVDASQGIERVVSDVREEIIRWLAARTRRRFFQQSRRLRQQLGCGQMAVERAAQNAPARTSSGLACPAHSRESLCGPGCRPACRHRSRL